MIEAAAPAQLTELVLRLYVAGHAPNSVRAVANVRAICETHFGGAYELEIVDMLAHIQDAVADGIIVTPTLLKIGPPPTQRLIGNLNDTEQLLAVLRGGTSR